MAGTGTAHLRPEGEALLRVEDLVVEFGSGARTVHAVSGISFDVLPEIKEYERTSTTVANAYIKPLAYRYLEEMCVHMAGKGIPAALLMARLYSAACWS